MWCVADLDEDYITKMEDVLEVYEQPYDPDHPVVCLDEKPMTLHADVRPTFPAVPGREARRDNEYERCGTANVFCAVEPKADGISPFLRRIVRALSSPKGRSPWRCNTRTPRPFTW